MRMHAGDWECSKEQRGGRRQTARCGASGSWEAEMSEEIVVVDDDPDRSRPSPCPRRRHALRDSREPDLAPPRSTVRARAESLSTAGGSAYDLGPNWCIFNIAAALGAARLRCARWARESTGTKRAWPCACRATRGASHQVSRATGPTRSATKLRRHARCASTLPCARKGPWRHRSRAPPLDA